MERRHDRQRLDGREFSARRFSRSCAALRAGRSVHSRGASDLGFVGRRRHRVIYRQRVLVRSNRGTASRPFDVSVRDLTRRDVAAQPPGTSGHFPGRGFADGPRFRRGECRCHLLPSRHALRRCVSVRHRHPRASAGGGQAGGRHQNPSGDSDRAGGEGFRGRGEATLGPRGPVHGTDGVVPCGSGVGA